MREAPESREQDCPGGWACDWLCDLHEDDVAHCTDDCPDDCMADHQGEQ